MDRSALAWPDPASSSPDTGAKPRGALTSSSTFPLSAAKGKVTGRDDVRLKGAIGWGEAKAGWSGGGWEGRGKRGGQRGSRSTTSTAATDTVNPIMIICHAPSPSQQRP